jgi:hypothetical protein
LFVPLKSHAWVKYGLLTGDTTLVGPLTGAVIAAAGQRQDETAVILERTPDERYIGWLTGSVAAIGSQDFLPPVVGDIDRDSSLDAVFLSADGELHVFGLDGEYLPGFPIDIGEMCHQPPALADVDLDGYLDILIAAGGQLHAYARNGALLPDFPRLIGRRDAPDSGATSPIAVLLESGDVSDRSLSVATAGTRQRLSAYTATGRDANRFPRPLGGTTHSSVAWAAMPADNSSVIFAHCDDGFLYAYTAGTLAGQLPAAVWPMNRRDSRATATVPVEDLEAVQSQQLFFADERAFVYPNPANDEAVIRYWLGDDAHVRIRIYDIAGNLVAEATGPGDGGLYNEWTWNCRGAASGVYFAHIEANALSSGASATVLCKMAVVQ